MQIYPFSHDKAINVVTLHARKFQINGIAMTFTIEINDMRIHAHHGVMEQERRVGNLFEVTVHLTYPVANEEVTDSLDGTINYAEVTDIIRLTMAEPSQLLEHVAFRLRNSLTARFPQITSGMVRVAKLTPPLGAQLSSAAATLRW